MMKIRMKIVLILAAVTLVPISSLITYQPTRVQAKQIKTKYGFLNNFKFPSNWRGKWYSNSNQGLSNMVIYEKGFNTPWTGEYVDLVTPTKVNGINKYPWQMGGKWLSKHYNALRHVGRVSNKQINGQKWIIVSPIDEKSLKMGFAFILESRKLDGEDQEVMFEADPKTGEIYDQFLRTPELAQKYHDYYFPDLNYIVTTISYNNTKTKS